MSKLKEIAIDAYELLKDVSIVNDVYRVSIAHNYKEKLLYIQKEMFTNMITSCLSALDEERYPCIILSANKLMKCDCEECKELRYKEYEVVSYVMD